ncbi:hypothetical protein SAMN06265365_11576 [Tistlia consotensis]|uniref:Uncharacterized protein n=1 Tax=Tistlia consotensis USBA 355 TaxID=560819 RepID=A0A1Y6C7D7_9PROT|nr:hypothetical protein [Tistlia consotensis]SMF46016.1 hypothetical protein SAMN05428998_11658 [Tistlia consotensis USBA 355]SNR79031.1 hypothetical protein SAMN06265365_11576 [Tistlia consotensis]
MTGVYQQQFAVYARLYADTSNGFHVAKDQAAIDGLLGELGRQVATVEGQLSVAPNGLTAKAIAQLALDQMSIAQAQFGSLQVLVQKAAENDRLTVVNGPALDFQNNKSLAAKQQAADGTLLQNLAALLAKLDLAIAALQTATASGGGGTKRPLDDNPWFDESRRDRFLSQQATRFYALLQQFEQLNDNEREGTGQLEIFLDGVEAGSVEAAHRQGSQGLAVADALKPAIFALLADPAALPFRLDPFDETTWYEVTLANEPPGTPVTQYQDINDASGVPRYITGFAPVGGQLQAFLSQFISLAGAKSISDEDLKALLDAWTPNPGVVVGVYDVGQGNANAVCDGTGRPRYYYDLGGGCLANTGTYPFTPLANPNPFCRFFTQPVVLSHWDWDHWASAHRNRYAQYQQHHWIVPNQNLGAVHLQFAQDVQNNGTLTVWNPAGGTTVVTNVGTIQRCTGAGRNQSGIAWLADDTANPGPGPTLLPGDARYNFIPANGGGALAAMVCTHHGGWLPTNQAIPAPMGAGPAWANTRIAYSYGAGNTFGHPRNPTVTRHQNFGWINANRVDTAARGGVARGHINLRTPVGGGGIGVIAHAQIPNLCNPQTCDCQAAKS